MSARIWPPVAAWAVGTALGLVDAVLLTDFVPRALPFSMTLYAVLGALVWAVLRLLGAPLLPDRTASRVALGLEAAGCTLLFGVHLVSTATGEFLSGRAGQFTGILVTALIAAVVGVLASRLPATSPQIRRWAAGLGLLLLIWPACYGAQLLRPASPAGRGLILVSLDAARGDRVSAHGYPRATTPRLDELVQSGLSYTHAVVQCPASGPSHATMLTGLPPLAHQVLHNADRLAPEVLTVAERLAAEGFATAGFADNFYIDARYGFAQGFATWVNEYRATSVATWSPRHLLPTTVLYQAWHRLTRKPGEKDEDSLRGALEWVRHRPAGDFFLFLHLMDPHAPYDAPPEVRDRVLAPDEDPVRDTIALRQRMDQLTAVEQAALVDLYDASIALADAKVGRLVDALGAAGLLERSLLVVTADHGEILNENGPVFDHGLPGQGNLHVPLILAGGLAPGAPGHRVAVTVPTTSWVPTAFAALGLDYTEQGEQAPVGPLPLDAAGVQPVYGLTGVTDLDRSYALMDRIKLLLGPDGVDGAWDLATDPLERADVRGVAAYQAWLRQLERGLLDWREDTAAAGIVSGRQSDNEFDATTREQLRALGYIE